MISLNLVSDALFTTCDTLSLCHTVFVNILRTAPQKKNIVVAFGVLSLVTLVSKYRPRFCGYSSFNDFQRMGFADFIK